MEGPVKKRGGFFKKRVVEPEPESPEAREAREALEAAARQAEEAEAARLAPAEREAYAAHGGDAQPLRRKLIDRLLRAEAYRRRGARLSGWKATTVPANSPAGPYNDFIALEQTVQRIASLHPEWAAEFLDLYGGLNKIRAAYQTLLPTAKR